MRMRRLGQLIGQNAEHCKEGNDTTHHDIQA
jgi:hypothetical protein